MEKGKQLPFQQLEAANTQALETMKRAVDACAKDWEQFFRQTVAFHRKNALSWANSATGEDLTSQIDPDYTLAAHALQQMV